MTIPAYPLKWLAAHAGASVYHGEVRERQQTAAGRRLGPRPDPAIAEAVGRLRKQLEHMVVGDNSLVISTNVEPRLDGLPRSGLAEPADPGAAIYWNTPTSAARCMAIDQYDRVADNLAAIAATSIALSPVSPPCRLRSPAPSPGTPSSASIPTTTTSWSSTYPYERSNHHRDWGGSAVIFAISIPTVTQPASSPRTP